jgi:hypothetical protein
MRKLIVMGVVLLGWAAGSGCASKAAPPTAHDSATAAPRRGDAWPGEVRSGATLCTTVVTMKPNRVVLRSGGCPAATDAAAVRAHTIEVDAAIRRLRPGEQTTVSTTVPTVSSRDR